MESKHKLILGVSAIGGIVILESVNIVFLGVDGGVLTAVCSTIAGIVGVIIGRKAKK